MNRPASLLLASALALTLALPGIAFAFDPAATAARIKELGLKVDGYKEATPETVKEAASLPLGATTRHCWLR